MVRKVYCPCCGKWLFSVVEGTKGTMLVWCRSCKKEIKIELSL